MVNVNPSDIQKVLRQILRYSKMNVPQLAVRAKLDKATLYRYLRGEFPEAPRFHTIAKIEALAQEYGIIPPWLQETLPEGIRGTPLAFQVESTRRVPVIGRIKAGEFVLAQENIEGYIDLPISILGSRGNVYALKVEGDSMADAGFHPGDYVVVDYDAVPQNGDVVVIINDAGEGTLKFFRRSGNHIILYPANPNYPTLVYEEGEDKVNPKGVVIAHIRVGRQRWHQ